MSQAEFFRVKATITYTGEWFVPIDEHVSTPEQAMEYVRRNADIEEPENVLEPVIAYMLPSEVWPADEEGERVEATSDKGRES